MVAVRVVLLDSSGTRQTVADPSGGTFDAAGDFDRLLRADPFALVWSRIDPYAETTLTATEMPGLLRDLARMEAQANPGAEHRGLVRLRALAERCRDDPGSRLVFTGE